MWLAFGFAALGLLIGNLVGLTSHSVVTSVIGLLFAFGGTSILAFLSKIEQEDRKVAGQCVLALSLGCLLGTYAGISVSEWHILSPRSAAATKQEGSPNAVNNSLLNKYLDSASIASADAIDIEYQNKAITAEEAYERLRKVVR